MCFVDINEINMIVSFYKRNCIKKIISTQWTQNIWVIGLECGIISECGTSLKHMASKYIGFT